MSKVLLLILSICHSANATDQVVVCPRPHILWNYVDSCQQSALDNDPRILKHLGGLFDMNCKGERAVVKCIRGLEKACDRKGNKVSKYLLGKVVDANTLNRTTDHFCENKELLTNNKDCLNNATIPDLIDTCLVPVRETYKKEIGDRPRFFSPNSTADVNAMFPAFCRYSYGAMKCHEVVKGMCDAAAVEAYLNLVYANVLNACRVAR